MICCHMKMLSSMLAYAFINSCELFVLFLQHVHALRNIHILGQKSSAHLEVLVNSVLIWNSKLKSVAHQRNTPHLKGLGVTPQKLQNDQ